MKILFSMILGITCFSGVSAFAKAETCAEATQKAFIGKMPERMNSFDALRLMIFPIEKAKAWCDFESQQIIDCAIWIYHDIKTLPPNESLRYCKNYGAPTLLCASGNFHQYGFLTFEQSLRHCVQDTQQERDCTLKTIYENDVNFNQALQYCKKRG